jgi:3-oxoacyl-[acyl-carrier protein] reductase
MTDPVEASYPSLAGKVAVVTGGSRGLGAATARCLASSGARVGVHGRDRSAIDQVVGEIVAAGGLAVGLEGDVRSGADLARIRGEVEGLLGPVDVLAAFAGGDVPAGPLTELSEDDWRHVVDLNLTSTYLTLHEFLGGMLARRSGSVILMASATARAGRPEVASAAYAASKGAVMTLCRHVATEVAPKGVRVNCVSPSVVMTDLARRKRTEEEAEALAATIPLRRLGVPGDVAAATAFLASDAASWITGITLDVAGGRVMP